MTASALALVLYVAFVAVAFGWRSWLQYRRTGDAGFRGFQPGAPPLERAAATLFVVGAGDCLLAPLGDLLGFLPAVGVSPTVHAVGFVLMVAGFALTVAAQLQMGDAWRIGVDPAERTALVAHGLFAHVRNPIFTSMLLASLGLVLAVPNVLAVAGFLALVVAIQLQVRRIEEPHLTAAHGEAYRTYARHVGRFLPGLGRLP